MSAPDRLGRPAYRAVLEAAWPEIRREFNYPLVTRVRLAGAPADHEPGRDAATAGPTAEPVDGTRGPPAGGGPAVGYRWAANEVVVSERYLDRLAPRDAADLDGLVRPLLRHELGHYVCFPRELVSHLLCLDRARTTFGRAVGARVYPLYADACNELRLLESGLGGDGLIRLRERTLESVGEAAETAVAAAADRRLHRLLLGLYPAVLPGVRSAVETTSTEAAIVDRLVAIDYLGETVGTHERNVVRFGRVLLDALSDLPQGAMLGLVPAEDRGKGRGDHPFAGEAIERIPAAELDQALTAALAAETPAAYDRLVAVLEEAVGLGESDPPDVRGGAGLDRADLDRNDDRIPFYRRWARGHPLFVADRSIPTVTDGVYPTSRRPYEVGDPIADVNPFASFGLIGVPSVSKTEAADGVTATASRRGLPDLLVGIDSSASMPDPGARSPAVLAAFVLGRTYHRNGAAVGGYNFSAEVAFLPPGRDLELFYALMVAHWDGGTVLDWATLVDFVGRTDELDGLVLSDVAQHEAAVDRLTADDDDRPPVSGLAGPAAAGDEPARRAIDHVLITDGDLANEDEVGEFLTATAARARNFLFVTDPGRAEGWADRDLPNTWVYRAEPDGLVDLALGLARRRTSNDRPPDDRATAGSPG